MSAGTHAHPFAIAAAVSGLLYVALGASPAENQPPEPPPGMPPSPLIGPRPLEPDTDRPGGDFASFALALPEVEPCAKRVVSLVMV